MSDDAEEEGEKPSGLSPSPSRSVEDDAVVAELDGDEDEEDDGDADISIRSRTSLQIYRGQVPAIDTEQIATLEPIVPGFGDRMLRLHEEEQRIRQRLLDHEQRMAEQAATHAQAEALARLDLARKEQEARHELGPLALREETGTQRLVITSSTATTLALIALAGYLAHLGYDIQALILVLGDVLRRFSQYVVGEVVRRKVERGEHRLEGEDETASSTPIGKRADKTGPHPRLPKGRDDI